MFSIDHSLFLLHIGFWASFGITRAVLKQGDTATSTAAPTNTEPRTAPYSRWLVVLHSIAFTLMYWGTNSAVLGGHVPGWFAGQRLVGAIIIGLGAALASWSLLHFRSWRFRAQLDTGHELATDGPFRLFRHPIYMALNLLALGSAIWVPNPGCWLGFIAMVLGSDLRARSEETLLRQAFGPVYDAYCTRTQRFIPGLY
ncbi:methyltransferase family protein [Chitinimonas naiadis]